MRRSPQLLVVAPLAAVLFGCASPGGPPRARSVAAPPETIVLSGVRVFDVSTGTLGAAKDILVENSRIVSVGPCVAARGATRQIDCSGKFALPGLFDCHAHLVHLTEGSDDELKAKLAAFAAKGVTQVRDVGGPIALIRAIHDRIATGEIAGP